MTYNQPNLTKPNADTTPEQADTAATAQFVTITRMAGDSVPMDYDPKLSVNDYLVAQGIDVGTGLAVTLNAVKVDSGALSTTYPEPNSVIVVAGALKNG